VFPILYYGIIALVFYFFILELKENKFLKTLNCGFLSDKAIDDADNKIAKTLEKRY
jgi:hypothetical protein